jgi:hypothetical protein
MSHRRASLVRPGFDFRFPTNILPGDALILVDEENRTFGGADNFVDLVVTEIGVKAGFFIQPMRLIDDQGIESVGGRLDKFAGPGEEAGDLRTSVDAW